MSDKPVTLEWQGSYRSSDFTEVVDVLEGRNAKGVYFYVQTYPDGTGAGKSATYVGKSENLPHRMMDHMQRALGLYDWCRTASGDWDAYNPAELSHRGAALADLRHRIDTAVADVERMRFCFAPIEEARHLLPIEARLIELARKRKRPNKLENDQISGQRFPEAPAFTHDLLNLSADGQTCFELAFGNPE